MKFKYLEKIDEFLELLVKRTDTGEFKWDQSVHRVSKYRMETHGYYLDLSRDDWNDNDIYVHLEIDTKEKTNERNYELYIEVNHNRETKKAETRFTLRTIEVPRYREILDNLYSELVIIDSQLDFEEEDRDNEDAELVQMFNFEGLEQINHVLYCWKDQSKESQVSQ